MNLQAFQRGFLEKLGVKLHRQRVELIATQGKDKVLGGIYEDGSFGIPGGGVDPDESWEAAAKREALEEMGRNVDDVKPIPIKNVTVNWDKKNVTDPWAEALADEYSGSRTYFMQGKVKPGKVKPKDPSGLKKIKFYPIDEAIEIQKKTVDAGKTNYLQEAKKRLQALKTVKRIIDSG